MIPQFFKSLFALVGRTDGDMGTAFTSWMTFPMATVLYVFDRLFRNLWENIRFKKLLWCVATARKSQKSKNSQGALSGLV